MRVHGCLGRDAEAEAAVGGPAHTQPGPQGVGGVSPLQTTWLWEHESIPSHKKYIFFYFKNAACILALVFLLSR